MITKTCVNLILIVLCAGFATQTRPACLAQRSSHVTSFTIDTVPAEYARLIAQAIRQAIAQYLARQNGNTFCYYAGERCQLSFSTFDYYITTQFKTLRARIPQRYHFIILATRFRIDTALNEIPNGLSINQMNPQNVRDSITISALEQIAESLDF